MPANRLGQVATIAKALKAKNPGHGRHLPAPARRRGENLAPLDTVVNPFGRAVVRHQWNAQLYLCAVHDAVNFYVT